MDIIEEVPLIHDGMSWIRWNNSTGILINVEMGIQWASRRWRGRYVVNATYRATIASLVYHLWRERNLRRFQNIRVEAEIVATLVMEQIRHRILSDESGFNL
ncbi:UNVERIFIED_CONTAM: hypothetical protein Sradi_2486700 [Sesamum radiatum]|uniref:Uncharacterized protein n=1 Tax=Sesamum radiatum TaxID=300843 RepID=A0AAW2SJM4_SESRA